MVAARSEAAFGGHLQALAEDENRPRNHMSGLCCSALQLIVASQPKSWPFVTIKKDSHGIAQAFRDERGFPKFQPEQCASGAMEKSRVEFRDCLFTVEDSQLV